MQTEVNLPFITADQTGPKHLNIKLTRAKLEAWSTISSRRRLSRAVRAQGCRPQILRDQRSHPGRRHDAHAEDHRDGEEFLRP
jgi:hypothetical protein